MATTAVANFNGCVLEKGDGASPEVFTPVPEVSKMKGLSANPAQIDVTSLDSGGWKEQIAGIIDPGTLTFTVNFDHTAHAWTRDTTSAVHNFKLHAPGPAGVSPGYWAFAAFTSKCDLNFDETAQLSADIELTVTGESVFTTGP